MILTLLMHMHFSRILDTRQNGEDDHSLCHPLTVVDTVDTFVANRVEKEGSLRYQ